LSIVTQTKEFRQNCNKITNYATPSRLNVCIISSLPGLRPGLNYFSLSMKRFLLDCDSLIQVQDECLLTIDYLFVDNNIKF
jgi:hypothetical protein